MKRGKGKNEFRVLWKTQPIDKVADEARRDMVRLALRRGGIEVKAGKGTGPHEGGHIRQGVDG